MPGKENRSLRATITQNLRKSFKAKRNTATREALPTRRFLYDASLVAAYAGDAMEIFVPDVDRHGVDVVLSDGDTSTPVQPKSTIGRVVPSTEITKVHQEVLKPTLHLADRL